MTKESDFFPELKKCLDGFGFDCQLAHDVTSLKDDKKGKNGYVIDFYISSPIKSFIEYISSEDLPPVYKYSEAYNSILLERKKFLDEKFNKLKNIRKALDEKIIPIIVAPSIRFFEYEKNIFKDLQVIFLWYTPYVEKNPGFFAKEITALKKVIFSRSKLIKNKPHLLEKSIIEDLNQPLYLRFFSGKYFKQSQSAQDEDSIETTINILLSNSSTNLDRNDVRVILSELRNFRYHMQKENYKCAVLMVGRALEYFLLVIVKLWGVETDKTTIQILNNLENSLNKLKSHFLEYVYSENENREKEKSSVRISAEELQKQLSQISWDIDKDHTIVRENIPVNIQALLGNAKKKFKQNEIIRSELNTIINGHSLNKLIKARNNVAHARLNLENAVINRELGIDIGLTFNALVYTIMRLSRFIALPKDVSQEIEEELKAKNYKKKISKLFVNQLEKSRSSERQWDILWKNKGSQEHWYFLDEDLEKWKFDPNQWDWEKKQELLDKKLFPISNELVSDLKKGNIKNGNDLRNTDLRSLEEAEILPDPPRQVFLVPIIVNSKISDEEIEPFKHEIIGYEQGIVGYAVVDRGCKALNSDPIFIEAFHSFLEAQERMWKLGRYFCTKRITNTFLATYPVQNK